MSPGWAWGVVACLSGAFIGCFSDPGEPAVDNCEPGTDRCPCVDGACQTGLACADDVCQPPSGTAGSQSGTTATDSTASTAALTSGSATTATTTATSGPISTTAVDGLATEAGSGTGSAGSTGDPPTHVIFVTSKPYVGGMIGSLTAADELCEATAQRGTWRAILSDATTAAPDRIRIDGPVLNMLGETIAANAAELWSGEAQATVGYDEDGVPVSSSDLVWVGSPRSHCDDWTGERGTGATGVPTQDDAWLSSGTTFPCNLGLAIYCISQ